MSIDEHKAVARRLLEELWSIEDVGLADELFTADFLHHNVPEGTPRGMRVNVQSRRNHITVVAEREDPRGRPYYWIEEGQNDWEPHDRSDYQAVKDGFISVTPLHPDLTHYEALKAVEALPTRGEVEVK